MSLWWLRASLTFGPQSEARTTSVLNPNRQKFGKKQRLIFIFNEISIPLKSHLKTFRQIRSKKNEGETQAHAIQVSIIRKRTIRSFATNNNKDEELEARNFSVGLLHVFLRTQKNFHLLGLNFLVDLLRRLCNAANNHLFGFGFDVPTA